MSHVFFQGRLLLYICIEAVHMTSNIYVNLYSIVSRLKERLHIKTYLDIFIIAIV